MMGCHGSHAKEATALIRARMTPTVRAQTAPENSPKPARTIDDPQDQVDPPPCGGVELQEVLAGGLVERVIHDGDETGEGVERADHDHHERREVRPSHGPAARPLL